MSQYGSWSVKGVDDRARAVAKEKARMKGVTLGDYINDLLLQSHSEAGPRDLYAHSADFGSPDTGALDKLARRIEAVEARSTLAITGMDQSVLGLLARLESSEDASSAMAAEVERMIDEMRAMHEDLQGKVHSMESDENRQKSVDAIKALENALGQLATHVYEESSLTQDETTAMKGRMEAGFNELTDRVEGMEVRIEATLSEAAKRVEKAVEQAELRAEGGTRQLSDRFSTLESSVATKLAKVDDVDARMKAIEGDVSGAISSMEGTLLRVQERLNRAETTTDAALKALEQSFASLDERIGEVAAQANPEGAKSLREEFELRFESLAADLRSNIEHSRQTLASEIERAASGAAPEVMSRLEASVEMLQEQVLVSEERSSHAFETVGEQIASLSDVVDTRVRESERRSANAIEQVGEQVATAIKRVQARQEASQRSLEQKVEAAEQQNETRLSNALANISDRLAEIQHQTTSSVSPVQKAIASLAARLEALEDFNAPPFASKTEEPLPELTEEDTFEDALAEGLIEETDELIETIESAVLDDEPLEATMPEPVEETSAEVSEPTSALDAFISSLPDFETPETASAQPESVLEDEPEAWLSDTVVDEDYQTSSEPLEIDEDVNETIAEDVETDPLEALGSWEEAHAEARDSDIFASDEVFDPTVDEADEDALAHNLTEEADEADTADPLLEPDDEATDYLSRARKAAIAAASAAAPAAKGKSQKPLPKPSTKSGRKMPIYAAASVLAIAAAGTGAWVMLRGKQGPGGSDAPRFAAADAVPAEPVMIEPEPSLTGIEYVEAEPLLDDTLFEEEGSAAGVKLQAPLLDLPKIPAALTLEHAAIDGDPIAQFEWGEQRLAAQDLAAGADFVRRSAEQGLPAAQYRLAKLHERGIGVPRDFAAARNWTQKAAEGGNIKAMHDLAVFFADGEAGPQSYAAAAEWFRKAADFGVVDSQYNLAVLYENGLGISPSRTEALYWYEIAAANGDAGAPANIATLRDTLPLEQAQTAQRRAANWASALPDPVANGQFGLQPWQQSSRDQVRALQTVLNALGYEAGTPDGIAGAGTRAAIRAFQAETSLEATGVIDEALISALNSRVTG